MTKTQTILPPLITILAIAHVFAIAALIGLILFSPIVEEMGKGYVGITIVCLTFINLTVNVILLLQARQKLKAQNFRLAKRLLLTAGIIFLIYNLIATLLNSAFLQNLLVSTLLIAIAFVVISQLDKQKQ